MENEELYRFALEMRKGLLQIMSLARTDGAHTANLALALMERATAEAVKQKGTPLGRPKPKKSVDPYDLTALDPMSDGELRERQKVWQLWCAGLEAGRWSEDLLPEILGQPHERGVNFDNLLDYDLESLYIFMEQGEMPIHKASALAPERDSEA